jgi:sulfonate transport system permease protein
MSKYVPTRQPTALAGRQVRREPGRARDRAVVHSTAIWMVGRPVLGLAALAGIWALASLLVGDERRLPGPSAVLSQAWQDRGLYGLNLPPTLEAAGLGFLLGNGAAILLGLILALIPAGRRELMGVVVTLYNIPIIAIGPLVEVLLSGNWPKIIMAALSVFFVTLVATLAGLNNADRASLDVVHAVGGSNWLAARKVRAWAAAPTIVAGVAAGVPFAVVGAMVGEFFGGQSYGLGVMLVQALDNLNAARVWGIALAVAVIGGAGLAIARALGRLLLPWGAQESPLTIPTRPGPGSGNWVGRIVRTFGSGVATAVILLIIWIGSVKILGLQPFVVRMPWDIWQYLTSDPGASANRGQLLASLAGTLGLALAGCAIGLAAGTLAAFSFILVRAVEPVVMPVVVALSSVPYLALVPILAVGLGRSTGMNLTLAAVIALLPTVIIVRSGLSSAPAQLSDVIRAAGGRRWTLLRKVHAPTALPGVFTALRIAAPWSVLGVILGEWLATGGGIGGAMVAEAVSGNYNAAWSDAVAVTLASVLLYAAAAGTERLVLRRYSQ